MPFGLLSLLGYIVLPVQQALFSNSFLFFDMLRISILPVCYVFQTLRRSICSSSTLPSRRLYYLHPTLVLTRDVFQYIQALSVLGYPPMQTLQHLSAYNKSVSRKYDTKAHVVVSNRDQHVVSIHTPKTQSLVESKSPVYITCSPDFLEPSSDRTHMSATWAIKESLIAHCMLQL